MHPSTPPAARSSSRCVPTRCWSILTSERRLGAGEVLRSGSRGDYRVLAELPGEPHSRDVAVRETIACIAHLTDLHVTDAQSPGRFEFLNRFAGDPRFRELLTMQRPQEMLNTHAVAAMVRAINAIERGPVTGSPLELVAVTGDVIDNTQRNELTNAVGLLDGGTVRPDSGAPGYDGVQRADWPGDLFWKPDGDSDRLQRGYGFPHRPGLLDESVRAFGSDGLQVKWLRCHGNHEYVCQGVGLVNPELIEAMTGSRKAVGLPSGIDADTAVEAFVHHPERFLNGNSVEVPRDAERRPIARDELMPEPYYVHDTERARFITLDTVRYGGGADGAIDEVQLRWLQQQIADARERSVIVLSHHPFFRVDKGAALVDLLSRSANVVAWLNGHVHANRITEHQGFWEVTTSSIVDWPCQARIVEVFRDGAGGVAIATTMVDHDGAGLAGLHRELAGNAPSYFGFESGSAGTPADRNRVLCCA